MQQPIFLRPVFQERIWGGTALREQFGYDIPSDRTGECWGVSAHPHGPCIVREGPYKGLTLTELWSQHPEVFNHFPSETFPLLTKILDADKDLSIQVHPDDEYAGIHEQGEQGKTECWYIIDCQEDAELVFGHYARNREELKAMVEKDAWPSLLRRIKVRPGDFFYIPNGTIHALCAGTLALEIQQNSDATYRVYDYNRTDSEGKKRELHLDKALDVTLVPHRNQVPDRQIRRLDAGEWTTFVECPYFAVHRWTVNGTVSFHQDQPFMIASIIDGEGEIEAEGETFPFYKGDHLILPTGLGPFNIKGTTVWITAHP
ncbi:mannose-6-phosphate isomerase, class I [Salinithrix halophila]|uniref:Mannose-6-phosphate isomerase n=1 Tax=Salinithrix halophila TaxID=1485204 RepID=A0ABV8JEX5_9BACL